MNNVIPSFGNASSLIHNFIKLQDPSKVFVLVDEHTKIKCLPILNLKNVNIIVTPSGESNKSLTAASRVWEVLLKHNADRHSLLINLGGGLVTDLGGYIASCYKRGIPFIHIPTSLLAMVDACYGGKTGINFKYTKNCIGTFCWPLNIFIDHSFLQTLDSRQFKNGKAEMIKHGLIANAKHYFNLKENHSINLSLIKESLNIKMNIVQKDPHEKNLRKILNFGHTIGHALESFYSEQKLDILHGEAIAYGMIYACKLSIKYKSLEKEKASDIINYLSTEYGTLKLKRNDAEKVISYIKQDKKNKKNIFQFVLLEDIGKAVIDCKVSEEDLHKTLTS